MIIWTYLGLNFFRLRWADNEGRSINTTLEGKGLGEETSGIQPGNPKKNISLPIKRLCKFKESIALACPELGTALPQLVTLL